MKKVFQIVALSLGVAVLFFLFFLSDILDQLPLAIQYMLLFVIAVCAYLGFRIFRKRRIKRSMEAAETEHLPTTAAPTKDTVLYLRPFSTDNCPIEPMDFRGKKYYTVESLICEFISQNNIPIAIGKPQEELSPVGAKRFYVDDDHWKNAVIRFLEQADYVLLYIEFTDGVKWEINTSLKDYRDKLILVPKVYNRNVGYMRPFLETLETFLMFGWLYFLLRRPKLMQHVRRGFSYYRKWNQMFGDVMEHQKMDDSVSAIYFENGHPVVCRTENGSLESQLDAILNACKMKQGLPVSTLTSTPLPTKKKKNLFKEPAYGYLWCVPARKERPALERKGPMGLCYGRLRLAKKDFTWQSDIIPVGAGKKRLLQSAVRVYDMKEGIPYADVEKVEQVGPCKLRIVSKRVEGTFYLRFVNQYQNLMPDIIALLERSAENGELNADNPVLASFHAVDKKAIIRSTWLTVLFAVLSFLSLWMLPFKLDVMIGFLFHMIALLCSGGRKMPCIMLWIFFQMNVIMYSSVFF